MRPQTTPSDWLRALLIFLHSSVIIGVFVGLVGYGAKAFLALPVGLFSGIVLLHLIKDGSWKSSYDSSWFIRQSEWVSREESPTRFWLTLLAYHSMFGYLFFRSYEKQSAVLNSLNFDAILFVSYIALFLTAAITCFWYLMPMSLASRVPKIAFILSRDFYIFCLFGLYAKVAKADGNVSQQEIRQMVDVMNNTLSLSDRETQLAQNVFMFFKTSPRSADSLAKVCYSKYRFHPSVLLSIVDSLLWLAVADGGLNPAEDALIRRIVTIFGLSERRYEQLKTQNLREAGYEAEVEAEERAKEQARREERQRRTTEPPPQAKRNGPIPKEFLILESKPGDPWETIKSNYHRLIKEHHPDRLASRKLPKQILERANRRAQEIVEAFDRLRDIYGKK